MGGEGLTATALRVERFAAMGTRVELHLFGGAEHDALHTARRAIEAVDDALTIHRPSPATAMNERLVAGEGAAIDDPILLEALDMVAGLHAATGGLFDPAAGGAPGSGRWPDIAFDRAAARITANHPAALDFGGFGKGYALDRAARALQTAGATSALLSAGESSIALVGRHPLGALWPLGVPHPFAPGRFLVELALEDAAVSISSSAGAAPPGRSPTVRPDSGAIAEPRTAIAVEGSGALAEAMSTALLVATADEAERLIGDHESRRFAFCFADGHANFLNTKKDVFNHVRQ